VPSHELEIILPRLKRFFAALSFFAFLAVAFVSVSVPASAAVNEWSLPQDVSSAIGAGGSLYYTPSPQVSIDSSGRAISVWLHFDGSSYFVQSSTSVDGGLSWSNPETVSESWTGLVGSDSNAQSPHVVIDASGRAIAVWKRESVIESSTSVDGGLSWTNPVAISVDGDSWFPQVSLDSAGRLISVWNGYDGSNFRVQSSTSLDGGLSWSVPEFVSAAGITGARPQVSIDSGGRAIAVWIANDGSNRFIQSSTFAFPRIDADILPNTGAGDSSLATARLVGLSFALVLCGLTATVITRRRLVRK
jgi:hypothetical protein